jgi:TrmH family RNA methyltransferase
VITSIHNKRVAKAVRLKKRALREKDRLFLVEGVQGVLEGLGSGSAVREVFHIALKEERMRDISEAAGKMGVPLHAVSADVMGHLTSTVTPQGVVAVAEFIDEPLSRLPGDATCVPVLVEVRDPGNAGTILRTADAAGADAVVFTSTSVDIYNPKTVRASAGSMFHLPVVREADVDETVAALRERGLAVVAADPDGRASIYETDLTRPTAILLGNEAHGLPRQATSLADSTVRVPIAGRAESLNLAAAAALVLFEAARQRTWGDSLSQIVAGAAHDVRSPLTALRGFASTLVSRWERLDDEQRLMMLEGITHDSARMDVIITQLVEAARLRSHRLELSLEPVDLLEAAGKVREELGRWSLVEVEVSGEPAKATVDAARLRTILIALIEAAQWWGEEGPVTMEVRSEPGSQVTVWRQGTSLDQEQGPGLFRARAPGTGGGSKVGLYVAKGLAEALGGELTVETPGRAAFRLAFPGNSGG